MQLTLTFTFNELWIDKNTVLYPTGTDIQLTLNTTLKKRI